MRLPLIIFTLLIILIGVINTSTEAHVTNWTNSAGGQWFAPGNWDFGVPTASDTAAITLNGTYMVTLDTIGYVEVLILGGESGSQTLHIQGGNLLASSSVLSCQIRTHGVLDVEGVGMQNGIIRVNSARDSAGLRNSGRIALHSNGFLFADSSYIRNDSGGVLYVWDCAVINAPDTRLDNYGTLRTFGLCGTTVYTAIWNYRSGTYLLGYEPLDAAGSQSVEDIHNFGFMEVLSRVQLVMLPIPVDFPNQPATIWNDGTCRLHGGALIFPHPVWPTTIPSVVNRGLMIVDVDTSVVNRTVTIAAHFRQSGGAGSLRVTDGSLYMNGYGDSARFSDSVYVAAGCSLKVGGSVFRDSAIVAGTGTINFYDLGNQLGGRWPFTGGFYFTSQPNDTTEVSFNPLTPPSVVLSTLSMAMPNTSFLIANADTVRVSGLQQDGGTISGNVLVTSTYDWTQGTYTTNTNSSITIPPGVTLSVTTSGTKTLDSLDLVIEGAATMQDTGVFTLVDSATINVAPNGTLFLGDGFTLIGVGTLSNSGYTTFDPHVSPVHINVPVINLSVMRTPGTIDILSGSVTCGAGGQNSGTINLLGSSELILGGVFYNIGGTINVSDSATLTINDSLVNMVSGQVNLQRGSSVSGDGQFINGGGLNALGSVLLTETSTLFRPVLINLKDSGFVDVLTDTLTLLAGGLNRGMIVIHAGAVLKVMGTFVNDSSGVLSGAGVLDVSGANFGNNGSIDPGSSPGLLTIQGNASLTSHSVLNMELSGSSQSLHDRLHVSGNLQCDGTVNLVLENNYTPSLADTLELLTFGSASGQFARVTGTALGNGRFLELGIGPEHLTTYICSGGDAAISFTPPSIADTIHLISTMLDTIILDVCNVGHCPLTYSLAFANASPPSPTWATIAANDSGIETRGQCAHVELRFDATGVASNVCTAQLRATSNDPLVPVVQIPVTITLRSISAITNLVIVVGGPGVRLSWPPVAGATMYRVYRNNTFPFSPSPSFLINTVTGNDYLDTVGVSASRFYIVTAVH